jgi:hypothetical protein
MIAVNYHNLVFKLNEIYIAQNQYTILESDLEISGAIAKQILYNHMKALIISEGAICHEILEMR